VTFILAAANTAAIPVPIRPEPITEAVEKIEVEDCDIGEV
jgi:hypothetical protein